MTSSPRLGKKIGFGTLPISMIISLVIMAVLVVGALAAVYLSQQSQELRQQAAVEVEPGAQCQLCNRDTDCQSGLRCILLSVGYRCAAPGTTPSCPAVPAGGPVPSNYATCSGSCCSITPAGAAAGCYVGKYQCPGGEIPCNANGTTTTAGSLCMDSNYCGSQQVDVRCPNLAPINVSSQKPASCGATSAPTSQPTSAPTTPPGTGGLPSPLPSPTPTSVCSSLQPVDAVSLQPLKTMPPVGQQVRFRCVPQTAGSTGVANYFFFTYTDSASNPLQLIYQGNSDLTFPIVVQPYMTLQCNPCVGTTCANQENVVNNCTFNYRAPVSPTPSPTPIPSPSPVAVTPECLGLDTQAVPGLNNTTNYTFTCRGAVGSNYNFFAYRTSPNSGFQLLAQGVSSTATLNLPSSSYLQVQCNPCINSTCSSSQSVTSNCTYTRLAPVAMSPSPSPSPVVGPQCLSITLSNPNALIGDSVTATCGQVQGAARYISRVLLPNGQTRDLAMTGRVSEPVQITSAGTYLFQCQICTGNTASTCQAYEPTQVLYEDPIAPPGGN